MQEMFPGGIDTQWQGLSQNTAETCKVLAGEQVQYVGVQLTKNFKASDEVRDADKYIGRRLTADELTALLRHPGHTEGAWDTPVAATAGEWCHELHHGCSDENTCVVLYIT